MEIASQLANIKSSLNELHRARSAEAKPRGMDGSERFIKHCVFQALRVRGVDHSSEFARIYPRFALSRSTTNPAMTSVPSWAMELTSPDILNLLESAQPPSAFSVLRSLGVSLSLAGYGSGQVPLPVPSPTPRSKWVAEAAPAPVVNLAFTSVSVVPRKLVVVCEFSGELRRRSPHNVEAVLGALLKADTRRAVDAKMLSADAGSASAPPGLLSGKTAIAGSDDFTKDVRTLVGDLVSQGAVFPALIVNSADALLFAVQPGNLGLPLIVTPDLPAGTIVGVDAGAFVGLAGDPVVDVSFEAVLHESDAPLAIVGGDGIASAPSRSLFQTDSGAIKVEFEAAWGCPRVAFIESGTW